MLGMLRNLPFFAASVTVHITILAILFSKPDPNELKEPSDGEHIVEVELIKDVERLLVERSIISTEQPDLQKELVVQHSSVRDPVPIMSIQRLRENTERNREMTHRREDFADPLNRTIITNKKVSKSDTIKEERIQKERKELFAKEGSLSVRILYSNSDIPDINIKDRKMLTAGLSDVESTGDRQLQSASLNIISDSGPSSTHSSRVILEKRLERDVELARILIQEKANRLVPVVYQKKLMEKRKRTAIVELILTQSGYVSHHNILKSTGLKEMDIAIRAILHLGEPYIYIPHPINIELTFLE